MKKYAKLLMVPVAFLGINAFSATDYTITDGTIALNKGAAAVAKGTQLTLKPGAINTAVAATTDATANATTGYVKCTVAADIAADAADGSGTCTVSEVYLPSATDELTFGGTNSSSIKVTMNDGNALTIAAGADANLVATAGQYSTTTVTGTLRGELKTAGALTVTGKNYADVTYNTVGATTLTVTAGSNTEEELDLSWTAVKGAKSYVVARSTSKTGTYTTIKTVNSTVTTLTDSNLTSGKTYWYKVFAVGENGKQSSATAKEGTTSVPVVTSLTAKSTGYETVKLTVKKVSGATGYTFYMGKSANGNCTDVTKYEAIKTTTDTTYTASDLDTGKTYCFTVAPYVTSNGTKNYGSYLGTNIPANGKDDTTNIAALASNAVTAVPTLSTPKISKVVAGSANGKVKVTVAKVAGAEGYIIYANGVEKAHDDATTITVDGITVGDKVAYTVKAYTTYSDNNTHSEESNAVTFALTPSAPKVYTTGSSTKVQVKEDATDTIQVTVKPYEGAQNDVVEYRLYKSTSKNGSYKYVSSKTVTITDPEGKDSDDAVLLADDLDFGETYYFKTKVRVNGTYSAFSNMVSLKLELPEFKKNNSTTDYVKATVEEDGNKQILLTIKAEAFQEGYDSYSIYRATSSNGKYKFVKSVDAETGDDIEFTDKKLVNGQKYYYRVRAVSKVDGKKVFSTYSTKVYATAKMNGPEDIEFEEGDNQVKLSWTKVSGAKGYRIYDTEGELLASTTKTTYTLKNLDADDYKFVVKAYTVLNGKKKFSRGITTDTITVTDAED